MSVRIAHLSDIHFGGEIPQAVHAAIAAVADFAPTLSVITGDLTLNGQPEEFAAARSWLAELPGARMVTPGNHDTPYWNLILRALTPFDRYRRYIGRPEGEAFDAPGLAARCLNSARGAQPRLNWSRGAMSIDQLQALDWGPAAGRPLRLFACHHPLVDLPDMPVPGGVHRGARAAAQLAAAGVDLVLTGHVHVPFVLPLGDADGACYAIGGGTLSQRTRGAPPSLSTLTVDETSMKVVVMAWTGRAFEPIRDWRLTRR